MTRTSHAPAGCNLSLLDDTACQQRLAWLLGEGENLIPEETSGLKWALAHCDDGVTWGRYEAEVWHFGNQVAPEVSPSIRPKSLLELRLFGEEVEVLIWRTDAGFRGRILREDASASSTDTNDFLRPTDEPRILRGIQVIASLNHNFTHVRDQTGAEQVVPLAVTTEQLRSGRVRLVVRHFYEADATTGAVRIAASRLVTIT